MNLKNTIWAPYLVEGGTGGGAAYIDQESMPHEVWEAYQVRRDLAQALEVLDHRNHATDLKFVANQLRHATARIEAMKNGL